MALTAAQKLIRDHLVEGEMVPGRPITLRFDQTLTQDATGTLVMLALEAMGLERVQTEVSAQYVDHNILQVDDKNADDHRFLQTSCARRGIWYSRAGNGVSHPVHMQRFGKPGKTLIGSDSHTCAAGSLGMLAVGMGGLDVATAMAGRPVHLVMPEIWGVKLTGRLPDWVSAKDVILELLRRHDVDGGRGRIIEYYGPGLEDLRAMDRHVIANMGQETGATTTVFPSDDETRRFLESEGRGDDWQPLAADDDAAFDVAEEIDLSSLEPMIAQPSSPGNVVPVREIAGAPLHQAYIGSSANPGYRDFAVAAEIVRDKVVDAPVSFDINPTSRQLLHMLIRDGHLSDLIAAGARLHQAGCNGCIGMGQAPARDQNSLRTVPRNFSGRSGTAEDRVFLSSPETAAASALNGCITDPRDLEMACPKIDRPARTDVYTDLLQAPLPSAEAQKIDVVHGHNVAPIPDLRAFPEKLAVPAILKVGDDISTDEVLPAGAEVLPLRSNIPAIAEFVYQAVAPDYVAQAKSIGEGGHAIIGGDNYGQGSSREHAALAPRYLGLRLVIAKSFSRIHWQNLINFGVLPLTFRDPADYDTLAPDSRITIDGLPEALRRDTVTAQVSGRDKPLLLSHALSEHQIAILTAGGLINWMRQGE